MIKRINRKWDKYVVKDFRGNEGSPGSKSPGAFLDDIDALVNGPTSDLVASKKRLYYGGWKNFKDTPSSWLDYVNEFKSKTKISSISFSSIEIDIALNYEDAPDIYRYSCDWKGKFKGWNKSSFGRDYVDIEFDEFISALGLPKQHWTQLIRAITSEVYPEHPCLWVNRRYKPGGDRA